MVHISNLKWERVEKVSDIVKEGDSLEVIVTGVDKERGKIELSVKDLIPKPEGYVERPPRGGDRRGGGGGGRGGSRGGDRRGPRAPKRDFDRKPRD